MTRWTKPWGNGSHVVRLIRFCQIPCRDDPRKLQLPLPSAWLSRSQEGKEGPDETRWRGALVGWAEPISPAWSAPGADRVIQRLAGKTAALELLGYSSPRPGSAGWTHSRRRGAGWTHGTGRPAPGKLRSGSTPQDWGIRVFVLGAEGVWSWWV